MRVTCTGTLYMCLGQEDAADLRAPLRRSESDEPLEAAIRAAIARKPKGHDFIIERAGSARLDRPPHERRPAAEGWRGAPGCSIWKARDGALTPAVERSEPWRTRERIEKLIADNPVVLFMKGTPSFRSAGSPARWCRFSTISARPSSA